MMTDQDYMDLAHGHSYTCSYVATQGGMDCDCYQPVLMSEYWVLVFKCTNYNRWGQIERQWCYKHYHTSDYRWAQTTYKELADPKIRDRIRLGMKLAGMEVGQLQVELWWRGNKCPTEDHWFYSEELDDVVTECTSCGELGNHTNLTNTCKPNCWTNIPF